MAVNWSINHSLPNSAMQYNTTEAVLVSTTWPHLEDLKAPYPYIAPANLILALFVLLQNTIIFLHCYKDRARLATRMFLMIALVDIISALVELLRDGVALPCFYRPKVNIPASVVVWYLSVGLACYNCSISFNVILAVVKTINIVNPFYIIKKKIVDGFMIAATITWFVIGTSDIIFIYSLHKTAQSCYSHWILLFGYNNLGEGIMAKFNLSLIYASESYKITIYSIPMVVEYLVPCFVVFVCMVIQMVNIRRSFINSSNPQQDIANHVNLTLFLVSMTFFVSNAAFCLYCLWPGKNCSTKYLSTTYNKPKTKRS